MQPMDLFGSRVSENAETGNTYDSDVILGFCKNWKHMNVQ